MSPFCLWRFLLPIPGDSSATPCRPSRGPSATPGPSLRRPLRVPRPTLRWPLSLPWPVSQVALSVPCPTLMWPLRVPRAFLRWCPGPPLTRPRLHGDAVSARRLPRRSPARSDVTGARTPRACALVWTGGVGARWPCGRGLVGTLRFTHARAIPRPGRRAVRVVPEGFFSIRPALSARSEGHLPGVSGQKRELPSEHP